MALSTVPKSMRLFIGLVSVGISVHVATFLYAVELLDLHPRIKPRHITEKEVRGPMYHVHKVDPMLVDLRESYDNRRLLIDAARPHFMSRREILSYHREHFDYSDEATEPTQFYESLRGDASSMDMKCDTCALVSNSGQLLNSRAGDDIDSAQCVFRINAAPSLGYELDVGRRTTARVVSYRSVAEFFANSTQLVSQNRFLQNVFLHGPEYMFTTGKTPDILQSLIQKYDKVGFYKFSKAAEAQLDEEWETHTGKSRISSGTEFSTGLYTISIMKDICNTIVVYGMIPESHCRDNPDDKVPYSYYTSPSLPECLMYQYHEDIEAGGHRLMAERRVFKAWTLSNNITFVHPSW